MRNFYYACLTNLPDTLRATKASVTLDGTKLNLATNGLYWLTIYDVAKQKLIGAMQLIKQ